MSPTSLSLIDDWFYPNLYKDVDDPHVCLGSQTEQRFIVDLDQSMQIGAASAPLPLHSSPQTSSNPAAPDMTSTTDFESLSAEERMQRQMEAWKQDHAEGEKNYAISEAYRLNVERAEREQLLKRFHAEQEKQNRDASKSTQAALAAASNGYTATSGTESRKRRHDGADNYNNQSYPHGFQGGGMMQPNATPEQQQQWMAYQRQQQQYQQQQYQQQMQQQMMNQQQHMMNPQMQCAAMNTPTYMPNGVLPNGPAFGNHDGSPHPVVPYPPGTSQACSIMPSTSSSASVPTTSDVAYPPSDPVPTHQPSPAVTANSVANSKTSPAQNLAQVSNGQAPTPPCTAGTADNFNLTASDAELKFDEIVNLVGLKTSDTLAELGPDLEFEDNIDYSIHATSSTSQMNSQTRPTTVPTPSSSGFSPVGQLPMSVTGPHSVHSVHSNQNPMSNGNCNPPMTPTNPNGSLPNSQSSSSVPFPTPPTTIGTPLFTSTPIVPNSQQQGMPATMQQQQPAISMPQSAPSMPVTTMTATPPTMPGMMPTYPMGGQPQQMYPGYPPEMIGNGMPQVPPMQSFPPHMPMNSMGTMSQQQHYWMIMQQRQHQQRAMMAQPMNPQQYQMMIMRQQEAHARYMQQMQQQRRLAASGMMDPGMMGRMPVNAMAPSPAYATPYPGAGYPPPYM